ncbi:MAG TPA: ABC transporter substrate-binding protein [Candidatus Limnocylindrales bacterium]
MTRRSVALLTRILAVLLAAELVVAGLSLASGLVGRTGAPHAGVAANGGAGAAAPIRIGAVFPTDSNAAFLAGPELEGLRIAARLVNADGGIAGRPIELVERTLDSRDQAPAVMADLKGAGVSVVVGAYASDLSIAASAAASDAGLLYWESGAVADQVTGRGLPLVFRIGTSGSTLGANSARFAATVLAPRLDRTAATLRVAIVVAHDDYARSVADAAAVTARAEGLDVVATVPYSLTVPRWDDVMGQLKAAAPDTIILASHIPDGIAFRQQMIASGLRVGALIGSTMAECDPDFAGDLGSDAIGIFASDRPTAGFRPDALDAAARAAYDRFSGAWAAAAAPYLPSPAPGGATSGTAGDEGDGAYGLSGPAEQPSAEQDEEALSGFSAGWALFHDVLPSATPATGNLDPERVASAARGLDLPVGALPNGAGVRFSSDPATLGQNERAAAVIWQWQAVRQYAFVWPASYATGSIIDVPLSR